MREEIRWGLIFSCHSREGGNPINSNFSSASQRPRWEVLIKNKKYSGMKFRTLVILTSILLFSFLACIVFTLRQCNGPKANQVLNENVKEFQSIALSMLDQQDLYMIGKIGFVPEYIRISPRTGKTFDIKIDRISTIDDAQYNGQSFTNFCTEYKLNQDFVKEIVNLILKADMFFIKKSFNDTTVSFGINYEESIVFKPNGVTDFEKKRYKLIQENWYYLKERM